MGLFDTRNLEYQDMGMELTKKETISFSPGLHAELMRVAAARNTSFDALVQTACEERYASPTREQKLAAARRLTAMRLPVGTPAEMKAESVPLVEELP